MSDVGRAITKLRLDPVLFVRQMLKRGPLQHQADVANAIAEGARQVSMRSGRRVGKTLLEAWLAIWWPMTRPDARVVVTAPSSGQLEDAFIPAFRSELQRLPPELYSMWKLRAERFDFQMGGQQGFENFVTIRTARKDNPQSLQGINALNTLVLVDEASGVEDNIFETLSGSLGTDASVGGQACLVLCGNPNLATGFFHSSHTTLADQWVTLHVNSEDCKIVGREWIEEMRLRYKVDSDPYRIHVLGEFPRGTDDTIIPVDLIESAMNREIQENLAEPMIWGVDVARFGSDRSVLRRRRGRYANFPARIWRGLDTMQLVGAIMAEWDTCEPRTKPTEIMIDDIGVGGGVTDRLRELGLPARGVNVSELPALNERFHSLKAELWWSCLHWLEARDCCLDRSETLRSELAMVRRDYTSSGKFKVESKREIRRRGIDSPDEADAFVLTFASRAATALYGRSTHRSKPLHRNIQQV